MNRNKIIINDPTLRDGNHAVNHAISLEQIATYSQAADAAGIDIIEVGHGCGLGASSLQLGLASHTDKAMLQSARANIKRAKLGVHVIPGFAKISDIETAIDLGVDVFRIASHCTEANVNSSYIDYVKSKQKIAHGVLMMSHMADVKTLVAQGQLMADSGAEALIIMDSAGAYSMNQVAERISALVNELGIPIGFHGHNNLGLSVANSVVAAQQGATILDATINGFGAGAGNTSLEHLIAALIQSEFDLNVDFNKILNLADSADNFLYQNLPKAKSTTIVSGLHGVCSAFEKHVLRLSKEFSLDPKEVYVALGEKKLVAGQEDLIIEIVMQLSKERVV